MWHGWIEKLRYVVICMTVNGKLALLMQHRKQTSTRNIHQMAQRIVLPGADNGSSGQNFTAKLFYGEHPRGTLQETARQIDHMESNSRSRHIKTKKGEKRIQWKGGQSDTGKGQ